MEDDGQGPKGAEKGQPKPADLIQFKDPDGPDGKSLLNAASAPSHGAAEPVRAIRELVAETTTEFKGTVNLNAASTIALLGQSLTQEQKTAIITAHIAQGDREHQFAMRQLDAEMEDRKAQRVAEVEIRKAEVAAISGDRRDHRDHRRTLYRYGVMFSMFGISFVGFLVWLAFKFNQPNLVPTIISSTIALVGGAGGGYAVGIRRVVNEAQAKPLLDEKKPNTEKSDQQSTE